MSAASVAAGRGDARRRVSGKSATRSAFLPPPTRFAAWLFRGRASDDLADVEPHRSGLERRLREARHPGGVNVVLGVPGASGRDCRYAFLEIGGRVDRQREGSGVDDAVQRRSCRGSVCSVLLGDRIPYLIIYLNRELGHSRANRSRRRRMARQGILARRLAQSPCFCDVTVCWPHLRRQNVGTLRIRSMACPKSGRRVPLSSA